MAHARLWRMPDYGACQYGESAMAHARLAQVQYDAGSIWRIPLWRSSSMANFSMPQFQRGAVPVWRCSSVSQFRRHANRAQRLCQHDCLLVKFNDSTVFVSSHDNGDLYNAIHR